MKTAVKKDLKLYSKRLLVISAITLTLAPLAVGRQQGALNAHADTTSSGSSSKGIAVKADQSTLNTAIAKAKAAGVNVSQTANKSQVVSSSALSSTESSIASDYAAQAKKIDEATTAQKTATDAYNKKEAQYKADLAAWEAYMKDPTVKNNTEWSKDQMSKFLGGKQANVTYISGNQAKGAKMTFDQGNVKTASDSDLSFFNNHTGEGDNQGEGKLKSASTDETLLFKLVPGAHWRYNNALYDNTTNQNVDVEYMVKSFKQYASSHDGKDNPKDFPPYAIIMKDKLGLDVPKPVQSYQFVRKTYAHATGKLLKMTILDGKGDVDAHQYYQLENKADALLTGSKITKEADQKFQGPDESLASNDLSTQVWTRLDDTDTTTWTWGVSNDWYGSSYVADYYADGNIDFGVDLKPKPQEPQKPATQTASYQLTDLLVTPSNHKDVEMGTNPAKDAASINGKTVDKGDTLTYPMTNSNLPANREKDVTSYVMTDNVQKELTIDQSELAKANSQYWDVKVEGQKVTYTANAALLKAMNADKSKAYAIPEAKLLGKVNADNVTIKNQFNTKINDVTTDSNVPENKVEKVSPSLVAKRVEDATGKLVTTNVNTNILTGKDVYFDIFNQYDNNSHTDDLADTDNLPKDAKVDTSKIKVMMSDGKADIYSMTADKLTGLTYSKDVTADTDITYKDGKLAIKPKAGKEDEFKSQQTKVRFAANLPAKQADTQLTKQDGDYVWNNEVKKGDVTSNKVNYNSEKDPDLIAKKVETTDGKFADSVENANILNAKAVPFDIFNQYNNLGETAYMTNIDSLPKDAQVDLNNIHVYLADDGSSSSSNATSETKADDGSSSSSSATSETKATDGSSSSSSATSENKADDGSSSSSSATSETKADATTNDQAKGKVDAKTMTKEKLATLTYSKDVTADFTVKYENGKLTTTPKPDKAAQYAGKQTKTRFTVSLATDKVDSELEKRGNTYKWTNQASNGKDQTKKVDYHADKEAPKSMPKSSKETPKETTMPNSPKTTYVKMAQTGHQQTWFDRLVNWF